MVAADVHDARGWRHAREGLARFAGGEGDKEHVESPGLLGDEGLDREPARGVPRHRREELCERLPGGGFAAHVRDLERRMARADPQELAAAETAHAHDADFHGRNDTGRRYFANQNSISDVVSLNPLAPSEAPVERVTPW